MMHYLFLFWTLIDYLINNILFHEQQILSADTFYISHSSHKKSYNTGYIFLNLQRTSKVYIKNTVLNESTFICHHTSELNKNFQRRWNQAITSAGFHIAQVIQLFSSWGSRRILPTNSYSCLSLLLVSHKKCRMNLIGPWHLGAFLRDQSGSSYISYVRQVVRTNKNIEI